MEDTLMNGVQGIPSGLGGELLTFRRKNLSYTDIEREVHNNLKRLLEISVILKNPDPRYEDGTQVAQDDWENKKFEFIKERAGIILRNSELKTLKSNIAREREIITQDISRVCRSDIAIDNGVFEDGNDLLKVTLKSLNNLHHEINKISDAIEIFLGVRQPEKRGARKTLSKKTKKTNAPHSDDSETRGG
jgi:hypothetical protein